MVEVFELMRTYARRGGHRLSDVAAHIIDGVLDDEALRQGQRTRSNPPRA
jgi:hypothetical protein